MDQVLKDSIRTIRALWGKRVSNHKDILISALKEGNFTPEERELCSKLISAFGNGQISIEEIEELVDSSETSKEEEIKRLKNLISKGDLKLFVNDNSYKYISNSYLNRLYKNQIRKIFDEAKKRIEKDGWMKTFVWYQDIKERNDDETNRSLEIYFADLKQSSLVEIDRIIKDLNINNISEIEHQFYEISKRLGQIKEVKIAHEEITSFRARNLDRIQLLYEQNIKEFLIKREFEIADEIYEELPDKSKFQNEFIKLYSKSKVLEIRDDIENLNLENARKSLNNSKDKLSPEIFNILLDEILRKVSLEKKIITSLDARDFKETYRINKANSFISNTEFSKRFLKVPLEKALNEFSRKGVNLDADQALAISTNEKSVIITARAGSGKTSVLLQRVSMLINYYGYSHENILVLVFNRSIRLDIISKLVNLYGWDEKEAKNSIHTFHSFAYNLTQQEKNFEEIEFEEDKVKDIFSNLVDKRIEEDLEFEQLFRKFIESCKSLDTSVLDESFFKSEADYLLYLRNQKYITLSNQIVKSHGEKYIADFLFEHDISYDYEQMVKVLDKKVYRPDFKLWPLTSNGEKIYWEHWGIDETNPKTPAHWNQTAEKYIEDMNLKRDFWKTNEDSILIETSVSDLKNGRESFEEFIKKELQGIGLKPIKLTQEEITTKLKKIWRKPLTNNLYQFYQKLSSSPLNIIDIKQKVRSQEWAATIEKKELTFYDMAFVISNDYKNYKVSKNLIDFFDLLVNTKIILKNLDSKKEIYTKILNLKSILIDEFQDFNFQFNEILLQLRNINPDIETFCVGDDWQAINSFMGADLDYFLNFLKQNQDSISHNIPTNYRSDTEIVNQGNRIMKGRGNKSKSSRGGGIVKKIYIDDTSLSLYSKKDKRFDQFRRKLAENINIPSYDSGFIRARYLKKMYELLNIELSNKSTLILTRMNAFLGVKNREFHSILIRLLKEDVKKGISSWQDIETIENQIKFSTAHKIKGGEAENVIILGSNEGNFPLLHPNNKLFRIFENTPNEYLSKSLEEERRLFYVASTRAKKTLYYLCERNSLSPFLRDNSSKIETNV